MSSDNLMSLFPQSRIKPYDGMPVTADVWDKAHSYHRQVSDSHNLFFHGAGILSGLEVAASDPADQIVFVLPGVAVDPAGHVIVLTEPVAYDLGSEVDGPLHLMLSHRESTTGAEKAKKDNGLQYARDEFLLIARSEIPEGNWLELARFNRSDRKAAVCDAADVAHPKINELDLRYRQSIPLKQDKLLTAALINLGGTGSKSCSAGLLHLAEEVKRTDHIHLIIDEFAQLTPDVLSYDLLYLAGTGKFTLTAAQVKGLQGYVEHGGLIFMDACNEAASGSFKTILDQTGFKVEDATRDHPLLTRPYLFAQPPAGFEKSGQLKTGKGLIFSTFNYSGLWNGEASGRTPERAEIRSGMEFGVNLLVNILEGTV